MKPAKITVVGYGEQHPLADNSTKTGRAKNRRVVIVVARNYEAQRLLHPPKHKIVKAKRTASPKPIQKVLKQEPKKVTSFENIPVVKAIRLESGGLKFTRGTANVRNGKSPPSIVEEGDLTKEEK